MAQGSVRPTGSRQLAPLFAERAALPEGHPRRDWLRGELIAGYLAVARRIARRYRHRCEPPQDLEQVASVGLILAVDRFDSPYGVKWLVSLSEVERLADERGIGSDKGVTVSSGASTETGVDQATDDNPVETPPPGQMLVPQAEWERVMGQMASVVNLAGELGDAKEAKGRAEAMAEVYKTKLSAERDRYEAEIARWQREAEKRESELQVAQEAAQRKRGWFRRRR